MVTDDDGAASLGNKSDAELAALEKDGTISAKLWAAVEAERARRAATRRADVGGDPAAATGRARPAPPMAPAIPAAPSAAESTGDYRIDDALRPLRGVLVPGETLDAYAVQRRLFALTHRRVIVAATSGRFISFARGLFGGFTLGDVRWQDLRDANLRAGIFGADLMVSSLTTEDLASSEGDGRRAVFVGLDKEQAQSVYRLCQAQEQAWREKRRVRDLDELRARSGGISIGAAPASSGAATAGASASGGAATDPPAARLRRAKEMLDAGLITDAEYESIKARVVDGL